MVISSRRKIPWKLVLFIAGLGLTACAQGVVSPTAEARDTSAVREVGTSIIPLPPPITAAPTLIITPQITLTSLPSVEEINVDNANRLAKFFRFGRHKIGDKFWDVAWSPIGDLIAIRYSGGILILMPLTGEVDHDIKDAALFGPLAWSPIESRIAAGNWYGGILFWDASNEWEREWLPGLEEEYYNPTVTWSSNGENLAFLSRFEYQGTSVDRIIVVNVSDGSQLQVLLSPKLLSSLAWSKDDKFLAAGSHEGAIYLWETSSGERVAILAGHQGTVNEVDFSPNGEFLASVGGSSFRIWNIETGRMVYDNPQSEVYSPQVAWSPNGQVIATVGENYTVSVWDAATGELVSALAGHRDEITSISWSPDNRYIASSSLDGTVIIWAVSVE